MTHFNRSGILNSFRRFARDRRGAVAVFLAAGVLPLVAVLALATDAARGYMVKARLSQAVDAAGLAAAKVIFDDTDMVNDAKRFRDANFPPDFMGATITEWRVEKIGSLNDKLELRATASIPTSFMRALGVKEIKVSARTVVKRAVRGIELALVMDNTGSMGTTKMRQMKDAAKEMVDILYAGRETVPNFWVSLVPYTASVNIGNNNADWLDWPTGWDMTIYDPVDWKGCVEARLTNNGDQTDDPKGGAFDGWTPYFWRSTLVENFPADTPANGGNFVEEIAPWREDGGMGWSYRGDNDWDPAVPSSINEARSAGNGGKGPNLGCGLAITPLVAEKTKVVDAINDMFSWSRGGTLGNIGLVWGWRTISPKWKGKWGDPDLPIDYGDPLMDKVVVILTDGHNQLWDWTGRLPGRPWNEENHPGVPFAHRDTSDYTAYGRRNEERLGPGINTYDEVQTEVNRRFTNTCNAMKAQEIMIYTITFKLANGPTKNLYKACATTPDHHFDADGNTELDEAFKAIGTELSNLRLAE